MEINLTKKRVLYFMIIIFLFSYNGWEQYFQSTYYIKNIYIKLVRELLRYIMAVIPIHHVTDAIREHTNFFLLTDSKFIVIHRSIEINFFFYCSIHFCFKK